MGILIAFFLGDMSCHFLKIQYIQKGALNEIQIKGVQNILIADFKKSYKNIQHISGATPLTPLSEFHTG